MPRAGIDAAAVVLEGGRLADESGLDAVTIAAVAQRLGVKAPALYKHIGGYDDLLHGIATLAMTELGDELRDTLQGVSGRDAVEALFAAFQSYVARHPGRYAATTGRGFRGDDDRFLIAATRVIESMRAVLAGYGVPADERDHAIRMLRCTLHGYAMLQASDGFQWAASPEMSLEWMIRFMDAGLIAASAGSVRGRDASA